jgi:hypothetical protein
MSKIQVYNRLDWCINCHEYQMPPWSENGHETARSCQFCNYVEERFINDKSRLAQCTFEDS